MPTIWGFSEAYHLLAEKTSNQEMKRLLKQNAQSLVEGELFIRQKVIDFWESLQIVGILNQVIAENGRF